MMFTFIWSIENLYFHSGNFDRICSPTFKVDFLENTQWSVILYFDENQDRFFLCLKREISGKGPEVIEIDYDLSFRERNGSRLLQRKKVDTFYINEKFKEEQENVDRKVSIDSDNILNNDSLRPDVLLVHCAMFKSSEDSYNSEDSEEDGDDDCTLCFARTRMDFERKEFAWCVNKFSTLQPNEKRAIHLPLASKQITCLNFSLFFKDEMVKVIVFPTGTKEKFWTQFIVSILNREGVQVKESKIINHTFVPNTKQKICAFSMIEKSELLKNQRDYLPNNSLYLQCECVISFGVVSSEIEDNEKFLVEPIDSLHKDKCHLKCDLQKLFVSQTFADMKLRVQDETFPVHKAILGARSPVFHAMFTSNMTEENSDVVSIPDVDKDTMRLLLNYIYTAVVEDLTCENASRLYCASDKYEILPLRKICSSVLKVNLTAENSCQVLILADTHQDDELKKDVEEFIFQHDDEIIRSEEWKHLEKENMQLVYQTLRDMYQKMKRRAKV